jgi:hypothetical protein
LNLPLSTYVSVRELSAATYMASLFASGLKGAEEPDRAFGDRIES